LYQANVGIPRRQQLYLSLAQFFYDYIVIQVLLQTQTRGQQVAFFFIVDQRNHFVESSSFIVFASQTIVMHWNALPAFL
jgi:hypothetical protein